MQHYDLDELIDAFLKKKLNASQAEMLKKMVASDAKIAETVEESVETYRFLQYLRYRQIKKQLQDFDEAENRTRKRLSMGRLLITSMFLLFGLIGSWILITSIYHPENLARRNFEPIVFNGTIPTGFSAEDTLHLHDANIFMKNRDYQNASRLWHAYLEKDGYSLNAKWNVLMCHLAIHGPDPWWNEEMTSFLTIQDNPLLPKGKKIFQLVNSSLYRFITGNSSSAITALKPRLI